MILAIFIPVNIVKDYWCDSHLYISASKQSLPHESIVWNVSVLYIYYYAYVHLNPTVQIVLAVHEIRI